MMLGVCACGTPDSGQTQTTERAETTVNLAKELLDGKKIVFIGNSRTYVGNVASQVYNSRPEPLSARVIENKRKMRQRLLRKYLT